MDSLSFEQIAALADRLTALEKIRLVEHVMENLKSDVSEETGNRSTPRRTAYGALADLHIDVSEEDIAEARRDMLANFPREDIG
jgi:hypothetical protein